MAIKRLATPLESIEYLLEKVDNLKSGDIHITTDTTNTKTVQSELERLDERIDEIESGGGGGGEIVANPVYYYFEYDDGEGSQAEMIIVLPNYATSSKPYSEVRKNAGELVEYINSRRPYTVLQYGVYEAETTEFLYMINELDYREPEEGEEFGEMYMYAKIVTGTNRATEIYDGIEIQQVIERYIYEDEEYSQIIYEGGY